MSNDFQSTPFDGQHPVSNPGNDWRAGNGIAGKAQRFVSYGNWAGPGNRMEVENADYIAKQQAANPAYDPYSDPKLMNDPRYRPIDGLDAAAQRHDHGYSMDRDDKNMFGWEGMHNVREDDRRLVADTQHEMDAHGDQYSDGAKKYSEGLRGFFGARVMGQDAVDWTGAKAKEAGAGVSSFVDGAKNWHSLGDAGRGLGQGATQAGQWLGNTAGQAWNGVKSAGQTIGKLGWPGMAGAAAGFGDVAVAGGIHLAGKAWDGAKSVASSAGSALKSGASSLMHMFGH